MKRVIDIPLVNGEKYCRKCATWKLPGEFHVDANNSTGYRSYCKGCDKRRVPLGKKSTQIIDGQKRCPKCNVWKTLDEFYPDINRPNGYRPHCRECARAQTKDRYHQADSQPKQRNAKNVKRKNDLKRQIISEIGGQCVRCGYKRSHHALDFHHTRDKDKSVADLLLRAITGNGKQMEELMAEVAKCVLLCSNCHRELHAGEWEL